MAKGKLKDADGPEEKLRSFLAAADGLGLGVKELVGRVESFREKAKGSAVLDKALGVTAKKLTSARNQVEDAHLALLGAITAADDHPPEIQGSLLDDDDGDGSTAKNAKNAK
jgi:hypothetical protein